MCKDKYVDNYKSIDIRRCYTSVLMNNTEPWAVFSAFDCIEPVTVTCVDDIKVGEYYIQPTWVNPKTKEKLKLETFQMGKGNIVLSQGFYPSAFVKYALENSLTSILNLRMSYMVLLPEGLCLLIRSRSL